MGGVLGDLTGATVIFKNKEDADEFASRDPFVENGIVTNYDVKEWSVVQEMDQQSEYFSRFYMYIVRDKDTQMFVQIHNITI